MAVAHVAVVVKTVLGSHFGWAFGEFTTHVRLPIFSWLDSIGCSLGANRCFRAMAMSRDLKPWDLRLASLALRLYRRTSWGLAWGWWHVCGTWQFVGHCCGNSFKTSKQMPKNILLPPPPRARIVEEDCQPEGFSGLQIVNRPPGRLVFESTLCETPFCPSTQMPK